MGPGQAPTSPSIKWDEDGAPLTGWRGSRGEGRDAITHVSRKHHAWHRVCAQKSTRHLSLETELGLKCQLTSDCHGEGEEGFLSKEDRV